MAVNRELHFRNLMLFCFGLTVGSNCIGGPGT